MTTEARQTIDIRTYQSVAWIAPHVLITLFVLFLTWLSFNRHILNYGTETDFIGGYIPEAKRFLEGVPLQVEFHPPLYAITLASVYSFLGDWFKSGLLLSVVAAFVTMVSCYEFFRLKFGKYEALAATLAIALSSTFVHYSVQATSDVFFHGLFFAALACIALAQTKESLSFWLLGGLFAGMAMITRTNGIVLLLLLLFALARVGLVSIKVRCTLSCAVGILVPLAAWYAFAIYTGSPVSPTSNYQNLALTYFRESGEPIDFDSLQKASKGFSSTMDVLTRDPLHIATTYIHDLATNLRRLFFAGPLLPAPFALLALPGLFVLFLRDCDRFKQILALVVLAMFLLLNFKTWEHRYFLYLVPFMGAGIGSLVALVFVGFGSKKVVFNSVVMSLLLAIGFALAKQTSAVKRNLSDNLSFDALAASEALRKVSSASEEARLLVIERKGHLSYYAATDWWLFPNVRSLHELKLEVKDEPNVKSLDELKLEAKNEIRAQGLQRTRVYIFYGHPERAKRPQLAALASPDFSTPWLNRVSAGQESGGWALYEVIAEELD